MSNIRVRALAVVVCVVVFITLACSKPSPQSSAPAPSQSSAATSSQPAAQSQASQPAVSDAQKDAAQPAATDSSRSPSNAGGVPAKEKYRLGFTNYASVPITISINGEWLGQWDNNPDVPLQPVVQGKNQLTVEIPSEPKGAVTITIYTDRDGQRVNILSLNFQGKSGTQSFFFVGK